jgi:hypothetical protein
VFTRYPPIVQKIDPEIWRPVRAGYKEANDILIAGRNELELLAQGSWRSSLPIACGLTDSPRRCVSAVDLAPPQRGRRLTQEASGVPCTPGPTLAPGRS